MLSKLKYLIVLFYILIIWIFPYAPLNDLPNHLASINIIDQVMHGDVHLSEIFSYDLFVPAIAPHILILILIQFLPILIASKIFLTFYVMLYLLSMEYFFKTFAKPEDKDFLVLISLLFLFNIFFYFGVLGFFSSIPIFFTLFTYFHKNQSNFLFPAFSLVLLLFFHIITAGMFLLLILFLNPKNLKKPKFYLSLLPFILLLLFWFSQSSLDSSSTWDSYLQYLSSPYFILHALLLKFPNIFNFSMIGITFVFILTVYLFLSKYKFDFKNKFLQFSLILLIGSLILPDSLPNWVIISIRFLAFFYPLYLASIPSLSKLDMKFALIILLIFHIVSILFHIYVFYDYNENIDSFILLKEYIESNSSIQYLFIPSKLNLSYTGSEPYLHMHHYLTLDIPSTYGADLYNYWYNPIIYKKYLISDFSYFIYYFDNYPLDIHKCEYYSDYYLDIINDEYYPQYDYIITYTSECDITDYFINEYEIISDKGPILMKLKSNP